VDQGPVGGPEAVDSIDSRRDATSDGGKIEHERRGIQAGAATVQLRRAGAIHRHGDAGAPYQDSLMTRGVAGAPLLRRLGAHVLPELVGGTSRWDADWAKVQ
jgi:hypothetical protein